MSGRNRSPLLEYGIDLINYLPGQVIPPIVGFLAIALYTRILDPVSYGYYILVTTTVTLGSSVIFSWIHQSSARFFQEYKRDRELVSFLSTGYLSLYLLLGIAAAIWFLVVSNIELPNYQTYLMLIGGVLLIVQAGYDFSLVIVRYDRKPLRFSTYNVIHSVGILLMAVFLIKALNLGPEAILYSMIVVSSGILLVEMISHMKSGFIQMSGFSRIILRRFALYGLPMIVVAGGASILSVSDRYFIQYYLNPSSVGIYSAGYTLAERSIRGITTILMMSASPVVFQTYARNGIEGTRILLKKMIGIYFLVVLPAVCGLFILSHDITSVVLGRSFFQAHQVLPWVAGGIFLHALGLYFNMSFQLCEKTIYLLLSYVAAGGIVLVLNFLWIPFYGIMGAAYATFVGYLIYAVITWLVGRMFMKIPLPWITVLKALVASSVMMAFLQFFRWFCITGIATLCLKIFMGILVYGLILMLVREETSVQVGRKIIRAIRT
jgi:O-antigen/teichoic acid export membrane protein